MADNFKKFWIPCLICDSEKHFPTKDEFEVHLVDAHSNLTLDQYLSIYPNARVEPRDLPSFDLDALMEKGKKEDEAVEDDSFKSEEIEGLDIYSKLLTGTEKKFYEEVLVYFKNEGLNEEDPRVKSIADMLTNLRSFRIYIENQKKISKKMKHRVPININQLEEYQKLLDKINASVKTLIQEKQMLKSQVKSAELFNDMMNECEKQIKDNIGDFVFKCKTCSNWVSADGLPFWAIGQDVDEKGNRIYFIGNDEVIYLINNGMISLALAAFILRTSPEGLYWTSKVKRNPIKYLKVLEDEFKKEELINELEKSETELYKIKIKFSKGEDYATEA